MNKLVIALGMSLAVASCGQIRIAPGGPDPLPASAPQDAGFDAAFRAARQNAGLGVMAANASLNQIARAHAADMNANGFFSHTNPAGQGANDRVSAAGIGVCGVAENIAFGYDNATTVFNLWMGSPGHRANILRPGYTNYGLGQDGDKWVMIITKPCI